MAAMQLTKHEVDTWLSAAADISMTPDMSRDELVQAAEQLDIDVGWMIPRGTDVFGNKVEMYMAYIRSPYLRPEDSISADTLEIAICLAVGEALVKEVEQQE